MTRSLLLMLLIIVTACASPDQSSSSASAETPTARRGPSGSAPTWVTTPYRHPAVHRATQMAGVGSGSGTDGAAREIAVQKALSNVTQTILAEVVSTVESTTTQRRVNDDVDWTEDFKQSVRLQSQGELPGHDVVESWVDEDNGETVVLVVVSRELLCSSLLPPVEQALAEAKALLDTPEAMITSQPGELLSRALRAYSVLQARMLDATKAQVVARPSPRWQPRAAQDFTQATALLDEASGLLGTLAGAIRIDKLSGDAQQGYVRAALPEPLTARLSLVDPSGRSHPLARFPARFLVAQEPGPSLAHSATSTDDQGLISCRVSDLQPTGRAANEIRVEPDFGRLAQGIAPSRIPSESFTYLLPTAGQTSVLVLISDEFEGKPLQGQVTGGIVGDHLSAYGFDVLVVDPTSEAGRRLTTGAGSIASRVERAHPGQYEFVLHGQTRTRFSSKTPVGYFYYSRASLQVDNLRTDGSQAITTKEAKGGHPVQGNPGISRALSALQRLLREALDKQYVSDFVLDTTPGG